MRTSGSAASTTRKGIGNPSVNEEYLAIAPIDSFFTSAVKIKRAPRATADQAAERLRVARGAMSLRDWYRGVYLGSDHWIQLRARKLRKRPGCEECRRAKATQVHHLQYRSIFDVLLSDLQSLCWRCHAAKHGIGKPRKRISRREKVQRQSVIDRKQFRPQRKPKRWLSREQYAALRKANMESGLRAPSQEVLDKFKITS